MNKPLVLILAMLGISHTATAQTPALGPAVVSSPDGADSHWVTVRLHAGPHLHLMRDWRDGLGALQTRAEQRGLPTTAEPGICLSWGSTVLVHVRPRIGVGVQFERLRDMRTFTVTDDLRFFGSVVDSSAKFGFSNETIVRTTQVVAAFWRLHRINLRYDAISDATISEARDLFAGQAEVREFVEERDADLTGGWARIGLAFRFGRR